MKKAVMFVIMLALALTSPAVIAKDYADYPQKFWDVPKTHWAFEAVSELVDKNVINGYEDGSFKPDRTVNRGEWAKMMVTAANLDISDTTTVHCSDLTNHWSNRYVNAAINYLPSYNDGTYKPDRMITRDVVTASMVRLKGYDISEVDYAILNQFKDVNSIGNYMKAYVAVAVEKGLISGFEDNTFRGQDTLTRAEAATILNRAFQLGDDTLQMDFNTGNPPASENTTDMEYNGFKPEPEKKPEETTKKPAPADKQEPEPEPEPEPKPYKIDTLVQFDGFVDYVIDNNDSVYYTDGKQIMKVDISSKEEEEILDTKDLTIDTDEYTLDDFEITSICYDEYRDRLLVQGRYQEINSAKEMNNSYLYEVKDGDIEVITDSFPITDEMYLTGVLSNGDYTITDAIIDCDTFKVKTRLSGDFDGGRRLDFVTEIDNNIYYISYDVLYKYDYVNCTKVFPIYSDSRGISNKYVVGVNGLTIDFYNFKGKKINQINIKEDCDIIDKTPIDFSSVYEWLLITENDDIIFYDKSAKAIRILSTND